MEQARPRTITVESAADLVEKCYELGWTDGLPVVPPTRDKVDAMARASGRAPSHIVGIMPPKDGLATVEKMAVNAVMAGCLPEYMPVVLTAVEALLDPDFNLQAVQSTTCSTAPLAIINGPVRHALRVHSGGNLFGPGWRANATIGRAIRLVLWNIGGGYGEGYPDVGDNATFGQPGKFTYCIAENEEASPWEPFHVARGFKKEESTVTVFGCDGPREIGTAQDTGREVLHILADSMTNLGTLALYQVDEALLLLCPDTARRLAADGFSRRAAQEHLWQHAGRPKRLARLAGRHFKARTWPRWLEEASDDTNVPVAERPQDIHILVAGATKGGLFSAVCPGLGKLGGKAITRVIETPKNG